jgi:hypothetical protein
MSNDSLPKKRRGAPGKKTPAICAAICEGIAQGKSARAMCIETGITQKTLWTWLDSDEQFVKQYARAKEEGHDFLAEQILEIADASENDIRTREDGSTYIDNEAVQRSRLRVDARKWYLSKLAPKKYGEKVTTELQGGDPDKPITHSIAVTFIRPNPPKSE